MINKRLSILMNIFYENLQVITKKTEQQPKLKQNHLKFRLISDSLSPTRDEMSGDVLGTLV